MKINIKCCQESGVFRVPDFIFLNVVSKKRVFSFLLKKQLQMFVIAVYGIQAK